MKPNWFYVYALGSPHGVVANVLDCNNVIIEFKLQLCHCIHLQTNTLGKGLKLLIHLAMGQIVPALSFNKDEFNIK